MEALTDLQELGLVETEVADLGVIFASRDGLAELPLGSFGLFQTESLEEVGVAAVDKTKTTAVSIEEG